MRLTVVATQLIATILWATVALGDYASAATPCKSSLYLCTIDGYGSTTISNSWAARYYGATTKGGIGTPPHNCTLFAAWMLARNGLPDPGRSWGYADQWGQTLAAETNATPAVGAIAWYAAGAMGHVGYVAHVNWTNHTVFIVSDNYGGGVAGYTSSAWVPVASVSGFIHLRDLATSQVPHASPRQLRR